MRFAIGAAAGIVWLLLLLPMLALAASSLGFPVPGSPTAEEVGLRNYASLPGEPRLLAALGTSAVLGVLAAGAALVLGIPAALGLTRGRFPGRDVVLAVLLSPLSLPGLVLGVALLQTAVLLAAATGVELAGTPVLLFAAHLLITTPWVARSVAASLEATGDSQGGAALEEQARSLGAGPIAALWLVVLPSARAGIAAGALTAFAISFGNFTLSLLLAGGRTVTLPVAIYEIVRDGPDPAAAAMSSLTIAMAAMTALLADRVSGAGKAECRSPQSGGPR